MKIKTFNEWIENKKSLVESNGPKRGEKVYFGIHDLARNNFQLDPNKMQGKIGQIVDIDPIEEKIRVTVERDPYSLGYHKLEDAKTRNRKKRMGKGSYEIDVPIHHCKDISEKLAGDGKTWLVVDRNVKYQQGLNKKMNKFMSSDADEVEFMNATEEPTPFDNEPEASVPPTPVQPTQPPAPEPQTNMLPEVPNAPYKMINRELVPNTPQEQMPLGNQSGHISDFWKQMSMEAKEYKYYPC